MADPHLAETLASVGFFYCETTIPKAKRIGIVKLNNPRSEAKRSGISDTAFRKRSERGL
jgi:hypothetical protein